MLRIITLAAAAALLAGTASAASIHVSTAGKTPEQIKAEVVRAAANLCYRQTVGSSIPVDAQQQCVARTVKNTFAQAPELGLTYAQK